VFSRHVVFTVLTLYYIVTGYATYIQVVANRGLIAVDVTLGSMATSSARTRLTYSPSKIGIGSVNASLESVSTITSLLAKSART